MLRRECMLQGDRERILISARVYGVAEPLLGRHVRERASETRVLGAPGDRAAREAKITDACASGEPRVERVGFTPACEPRVERVGFTPACEPRVERVGFT